MNDSSHPTADRPRPESDSDLRPEPNSENVASLPESIRPPAMDPQITTIQPGGGVVMRIELAWGHWRRGCLRRLRPGYVRRMAATRRGDPGDVPFVPVDPRDLKYYQNQPTCFWDPADDPFRWRNRLGFVRAGLAELLLIGGLFAMFGIAAAWLWWPLGIPFWIVTALVIWFFRNPTRSIPDTAGTVTSPADGKLVEIERIEDPELGSCVQFGIFLSIFNVHANRSSLPGRVVKAAYRPGKFLNALRPESARENENLDVYLQSGEIGDRVFRIRQITGQFARRIVCWVRPGDRLSRGEMYGMIKLGSRTELVIPDDDALVIQAKIGQKVQAGSTVLAVYTDSADPSGS